MSKKLILVENFKPFKGDWGVMCAPNPCDQGWFVPDGWQKELRRKGIVYKEVPQEAITFKAAPSDKTIL